MTDSLRHATWRDLLGWVCHRCRRLRITGASMQPLLSPGEEVLIDSRAYAQHPPQPGDIVVVYHPQRRSLLIIKRVVFVEPDGRCYLKGDNAIASTDSRQFGLIPWSQIYGQVICRFP